MPWIRRGTVLADPAWVFRQVIRRVPAILGRVDPPAKCQRIIGYDNLLVVAGAKGMVSVQGKMNAIPTKKAQRQRRHQTPRCGQHGPVPFQQIHVEFRRPLHHRLDKGTKLIGVAVRRIAVFVALARQHFELKVKIPADQHQLLSRPEENFAQNPEVIRRIHNQTKTVSPRDAPSRAVIEKALAVSPISRKPLVRLCQTQIAAHVHVPSASVLHG